MSDPSYNRGMLSLPEPDPDGRTAVPVKQIGKGAFSRAYLTKTGTPYVYLITAEQDGGDYSKRQLAELSRDEDHSPYLPRLLDVGCDERGRCYYRMPYYRAPLRKADSPKAWAQYQMLRKCWLPALERLEQRKDRHGATYAGHTVMEEVVECASEAGASPGLVRALDLLRGAASNYGSDYSFEFSPRNLATTDKGQLILLDTVFSLLVARQALVASRQR